MQIIEHFQQEEGHIALIITIVIRVFGMPQEKII